MTTFSLDMLIINAMRPNPHHRPHRHITQTLYSLFGEFALFLVHHVKRMMFRIAFDSSFPLNCSDANTFFLVNRSIGDDEYRIYR